MFDEQWYIVADFEIMIFCWKIEIVRFLKILNISIDVRIYFLIQSLLLKGVFIYSLDIHKIFWYVKM